MPKSALLLLVTFPIAAAAQPRTYQVVEVEAVRAEGDPAQWVRSVTVPANPREYSCDILVAGAGAGGFAAALAAAELNHTVCLTEETNWIGGQITAGGVPALDENRFIEFSGGTRNYYEMRRRIREYYRRNYPLVPEAARLENLNPGSCYVSPLCFEPKAGLAVLDDMLAPHRDRIQLFLRTAVFSLDMAGGVIRAALAYRFDQRDVIRFRPRFVLDATETGDLLPMAGVLYVVGSEAKSETNEPHAGPKPNPACVQSFTYPFAIEHRPGKDHRIPKPPEYEKLRDEQGFSLRLNYPTELGWKGDVQYSMFGEDPPIPNNQSPRSFFTWRRLLARKNFTGPSAPADLALINWPRQDYQAESLLDRTPLDIARVLQQAKRVSLAFLYWLQSDVPRDDNRGRGYPELMLQRDVMGSPDGLSKAPYIRESRRLRARGRVVEQDIVSEHQPGPRARWFPDSVGTGFYMVDIHPCGAGERGRMMMPRPFQIPMGALIPQGLSNFLAAGKNIGVTHLTNGAFRLHPVEWNVGEAAATIASLALRKQEIPDSSEVQSVLARRGVALVWFDDLSPHHPSFAAVQLAAIRGAYPLNSTDLHASVDAPLSRGEAAGVLAALFGVDFSRPLSNTIDVPAAHPHAAAIGIAVERGWMATDHRNWFHPDLPFYWTDWREDRFPRPLPPSQWKRSGPVTRGEMAQRLLERGS